MTTKEEFRDELEKRGLFRVTERYIITLNSDETINIAGELKASELCILADVLCTTGVGDCGAKCHDCAVPTGSYHKEGCGWEQCPFCRERLFSCDCRYEHLGLIDSKKYTDDTGHLPPDIYENGLSNEQYNEWFEILLRKGRIRFGEEDYI